MEIFERAAQGDFGSIVILVIAGLFLLRFILKLLKFVIVQFPALAGGLFFGLIFAGEDGIDVGYALENPILWEQLVPYVLPALAVGFIIWNVVLSILKAVFRSMFKSGSAVATETRQSVSQTNRRKERARARDDDGVVSASEASAMKTRKRHMDEYETRNNRIKQHEMSHRDKNKNEPMIQRRIKANKTVTRRINV